MKLRDLVTFDANFPDDAQWDGHGNLLVPGGRAAAEAIRARLQQAGVSCSAVSLHSFYGWGFHANSEQERVWCLLQAGEGYLLTLDLERSMIARLFGPAKPPGFVKLQSKIHNIFMSDDRFSNVLWYTKADYDSGKKERAHNSPA